jgi:cell division protein FtsN
MTGPERRQTTRTTVEKFVYINIEPENAGSVSNVSEGGLCFHSIAPVPADKEIRFWFSDHNRRIEVDGELAWTKETRKTVGLRFTTLPSEAREPIRDWINPLIASPAADEPSIPPLAPQSALTLASASRSATKTPSDISEPLAVVSPVVRKSTLLRGFSGGLATGFLVSALVVAAFLFHSYRRRLGVSLIQLGERLAANQMQNQPGSPTSQALSPPRRTVSSASAPIPVQRSKLEPQFLANSVKPQQRNLEPSRPTSAKRTLAADAGLKAPAAPSTATISSTRRTIYLPTIAVAPTSTVISVKPNSIPKVESQSHPGAQNEKSSEDTARSTPGVYLEVGRFKEGAEADKARNKLTQLGFHASIIQRSRFYAVSYHVLVGPYKVDDAEAERKILVSYGFRPRGFEAGSRNLSVHGGCDTMSLLLHSQPTPNRLGLPEQDCLISWETYNGRAIVKFAQDNYVFATADGIWVNRGFRFVRDAFVYRQNNDGSQTLIEIQFTGMSRALVFYKLS